MLFFDISLLYMNNIIYCKFRGACDISLIQNLKAVTSGPRPNLLVLTETRCSDENNFTRLRSLGFDSFKMILSVGRSRGIVTAWRSNLVNISILQEDC